MWGNCLVEETSRSDITKSVWRNLSLRFLSIELLSLSSNFHLPSRQHREIEQHQSWAACCLVWWSWWGCDLGWVTWLRRSRCTTDLSLGVLLSSPGCCYNWKNISQPQGSPCSSPHLLYTFLPAHHPPTVFLLQACAPLYSWRTEKDIPLSDATGTCYLSVRNFTKFVEYAPCRTGNHHTWCRYWNHHKCCFWRKSMCFRNQWRERTGILSGRIQRRLHNGKDLNEQCWQPGVRASFFPLCSNLPGFCFRMAKWY